MARGRTGAGERLRMALELHELGVRIMTQNLRRRFPSAKRARIERMLDEWLAGAVRERP